MEDSLKFEHPISSTQFPIFNGIELMLNITLKACSDVAYGFNHRANSQKDCVLKGRSIFVYLSFLLKNNSVSSRRMVCV
jgi:hypothetical protein